MQALVEHREGSQMGKIRVQDFHSGWGCNLVLHIYNPDIDALMHVFAL